MAERTTTLYADKEKTEILYPHTRLTAIYDDAYNTTAQPPKTLKDVLDSIKSSITSETTSRTAAINELSQSLSSSVSSLNTDISNISNSVSIEAQDRKNADNALQGSIDALDQAISAIDNSELIGIRIGYDDTVYADAGTAVRTQIEDVRNYVDSLTNLTEVTEAQIDAMFNGETVIDGDADSPLVSEISESEIDAMMGG